MNFDAIDRALTKLEKKEMKVKTTQLIATKQLRTSFVKLQRLKKQKRFLREKEQKMFDKKFSNVKKLKRLKNLEQAIILKQTLSFAFCFDDFTMMFLNTLGWLNSLVFETLATFVDNSQGSWVILKYSPS